MREHSITCDRCKASVKYKQGDNKPLDWERVHAHDLCPMCADAVSDFFDGAALITEQDRCNKDTTDVQPSNIKKQNNE